MNFLNKKVIVTGANRSIGQSIAIAFATEGADVVISYRSDKEGADATVRAIQEQGRKGLALYSDFSEMKNVAVFANQAIAYLGRVDILINNAGMLSRENIMELVPEKMQQVFQVNTVSPLYLLQLCAKNMIENTIKGVILNISSIAGIITMPKGICYAASKAAMNKWTKNSALSLAEHQIRVNAIAPGVVQAGMNEDTSQSNLEL